MAPAMPDLLRGIGSNLIAVTVHIPVESVAYHTLTRFHISKHKLEQCIVVHPLILSGYEKSWRV